LGFIPADQYRQFPVLYAYYGLACYNGGFDCPGKGFAV